MTRKTPALALCVLVAAGLQDPVPAGDAIELVRDIEPGAGHGSPSNLFPLGDGILFHARTTGAGEEIWRSDGSESGTGLVRDLVPGPEGQGIALVRFGALEGRVFLSARDGLARGHELWSTDGTEAGTLLVKEILPGPRSSAPGEFLALAGALYFSATSSLEGRELWRTDGTEPGTVLVRDILAGGPSSDPRSLTLAGDGFFFSARDDDGIELWMSDGTGVGTVQVLDIHPGVAPPFGSPNSSSPAGLRQVGDVLLFHADDGLHGRELWRSDGTPAGTWMVADIQPGASASFTGAPVLVPVAVMDGAYYFRADDGIHGEELWRSDGTGAGTVLVADLHPGAVGSAPRHLTVVGSEICFAATTPAEGEELWCSDGTAAGTFLVRDILPGPEGSRPSRLTNVGGILHFAAFLEDTGTEIWRSDLTAGGTALVEDLNPGEDGAVRFGTELLHVDGMLYMGLLTPETGMELYRIDARGPRCGGQAATVHVDASGIIRGGLLDGQPYRGLLLGTPGDDVMVGTPGNDRMVGLAGSDVLCGGGGDDRIVDPGRDDL